VFSCSESEQKQLNTWVSFQSAEQPLLGQFSVSGNNNGSPQPDMREMAHYPEDCPPAPRRKPSSVIRS